MFQKMPGIGPRNKFGGRVADSFQSAKHEGDLAGGALGRPLEARKAHNVTFLRVLQGGHKDAPAKKTFAFGSVLYRATRNLRRRARLSVIDGDSRPSLPRLHDVLAAREARPALRSGVVETSAKTLG